MTTPDNGLQVPPWPNFTRPLLEVLSDGQMWTTRDLKAATLVRAGLSVEQLARKLNSGQGQADPVQDGSVIPAGLTDDWRR